jgi:hypothetical protein
MVCGWAGQQLLKLAEHIRSAQEHAVNCAERPAQANSPGAKDEWLAVNSYLFLEHFIRDADKARAGRR